jgi:2-keto-4-pentenoate hydratase
LPEATAQSQRTLSDAEVDQLAEAILTAERQATPIPPLTEQHPHMTLADAYAVQQGYAERRMRDGARLVGHKVGATSKAIQELFGIATPDFGHLFDDMLVAEHEPMPVAQLIEPMTEPELAFVLDRELRGPGVSADDVIAATRHVLPCIEVIDSRVRSWQIKLPDTVADNGSSARFIVGATPVQIGALDLAAEEGRLIRNGEVAATGRGEAVLGHPALAVAWLANALSEFGAALPADAYVLSGSMTTAVRARPGDRYQAVFTNIGSVGCRFT